MIKKKVLFICGSLNQTTMMHRISMHMEGCDCYFSPYYADKFLDFLAQRGILDFCILGGKFKQNTLEYMNKNNLQIDYKGTNNNYDLVFTCSDLIVPKNARDKRLILVQEGMTDPENLVYHIVKNLNLPRWIASTSTTGISNLYDLFCVASEGYREHFIKKGARPEKIIVTGIPNFDNAAEFLNNDFPHKNYVMVATSDMRETFKYENRKKFIQECVTIANGKQLLFKLHPNENVERATAEIEKYAPGSLVFSKGNTDHMIANCDVLITKFSSVVYIGLALGKEVHSYFNLEDLKKLNPIQNGGTSASAIAAAGIKLMEKDVKEIKLLPGFSLKFKEAFGYR
jgi:hypothetical protein